MVEYSYEFFPDGNFGVNIMGLHNMEKETSKDSWLLFVYYLESLAPFKDSDSNKNADSRDHSITSDTHVAVANRRKGDARN